MTMEREEKGGTAWDVNDDWTLASSMADGGLAHVGTQSVKAM